MTNYKTDQHIYWEFAGFDNSAFCYLGQLWAVRSGTQDHMRGKCGSSHHVVTLESAFRDLIRVTMKKPVLVRCEVFRSRVHLLYFRVVHEPIFHFCAESLLECSQANVILLNDFLLKCRVHCFHNLSFWVFASVLLPCF